MNSFLTFANKDSKVLSSLPSIPSFPGSSPQSNFNNSPQLEAKNLNGLYNLNSYLSPSQSRTRASSINTMSPIGNYSPIRGPVATPNPELTNILLNWKLQQNLQTELFKQQMQQILELKSCLLEKLSQQQAESQVHVPTQVYANMQEKAPVAQDTTNVKIEASVEIPPLILQGVPQPSCLKNLKVQVREILNFVLENFGRVSESNFDKEKVKYSYDSDLVALFDILTSKYASTIKTKEEMVKYTLRRAFKFIKNDLKRKCNANNKAVSKTICNKYFNVSEDEMSKVGTEEEVLKVLLPFRKNSKNKTMNTTFIGEVFSSEQFCSDYQIYLEHFEGILEADNKNKIERFASFIEDCIRKGNVKDIKGYKRIPWPKLWILNTKNVAQSLPHMSDQSILSPADPTKKCKNELSVSPQNNIGSMIDNDCCSEASTNSHSNY